MIGFRRRNSADTKNLDQGPETDLLWKHLSSVNEWIRHADVKAGITLASAGALGTVLFNLVKDFQERTQFFDALVIGACLAFAATAFFCGLTLNPRIKDSESSTATSGLIFFGSIDGEYRGKRAEFRNELTALCSRRHDLALALADQVHVNAHIATVKTKWAKCAIWSVLVSSAFVFSVAIVIGLARS